MEAMQTAADQYLVFSESNKVTKTSWSLAWSKIPGICRVSLESKNRPYLRDLYYIRGIIRKREIECRDWEIMELLEAAVRADVSIDELKRIARSVRDWRDFEDAIDELLR
jgi:hypothetical protein